MAKLSERPWHEVAKDDEASLPAVVKSICDTLWDKDAARRTRYERHASLYEGRPVTLTDYGYYLGTGATTDGEPPKWNFLRSACDSLHAEICGRQKPKPQAVGTSASWRTKRRALKLDRFVEAHFHQAQGSYADAWELISDCGKDWVILGAGCVKTYGDLDQERVALERVWPWEVLVDPVDGQYGDPGSMFHVYEMAESEALASFEDKNGLHDKIRIAAKDSEGRVGRVVQIREGWYRARGQKRPGRHVITADNVVLVNEEWADSSFPIYVFHFSRPRRGYWGVGLPGEAEAAFEQLERTSKSAADRVRICSVLRTFFQPGTVSEEHLKVGGDGETEILIPVTDMSRAPVQAPTNPISSGEFQFLTLSKSWFFESIGLSEMSASAKKDPGVTAAVAMRALNDIQSVRFLPRARVYEQVFPEVGRRMIRAVRHIASKSGAYLVRWPGGKFLSAIEWSRVSLEEDMYEIRLASTNAFSRDPALVLQLGQELLASNVISQEQFLGMVGLPDLDKLVEQQTAEQNYLEDLAGRFLDAEDAADLDELGGYESPEPLITNKPASIAFMLATYFDAKREGAPEFNLELLRRWIAAMDHIIAQAMPQQGPPAGAMPPGATPPVPMPGPMPVRPPMPVAA